ncbi:hypothetical protein M9458_035442, partial [Cirrhinus mrigala]
MYKPVNAFIFDSQDGLSGVNEQRLAAFHEVILPSLEQISNCTCGVSAGLRGRDCSVRSPRRPPSCDVTRPDISRGSGRETETLANRTRPPQIP